MAWVRGHRLEVKYALIGLALVGTLFALQRTGALASLSRAVQPTMEALAGLGLLGAFLLGLIGNSSLLMQVPYAVPLVSAALAGAPTGYVLTLAVAAGVGATIGELVSYGIAEAVMRHQRDLPRSALFRWVDRTVRTHPRTIPWLVFGFGVTLLPDDAVLIPLATVRYGASRLVLPLLIGKIGYCIIVSLVAALVHEQAQRLVSAQTTFDVGLFALITFFLVIFYQVEKARTGSVSSQEARMTRHLIGHVLDFAPGVTEREVAGTKVIIVKDDEGLCAARNKCPHLGLSLTSGPGGSHYDGGVVRCPWHNSTFVVRTGENLDWASGIAGKSVPRWSSRLLAVGRKPSPLTTYPVTVVGDEVFIDI